MMMVIFGFVSVIVSVALFALSITHLKDNLDYESVGLQAALGVMAYYDLVNLISDIVSIVN